MRIGIVREFMVNHTPDDAPIGGRINKETGPCCAISWADPVDPLYQYGPTIFNLKPTSQRALNKAKQIMGIFLSSTALRASLGSRQEKTVPPLIRA
jgi:hypothetical protein